MLATLVIGLREGLEAALIVGIIAAFLRRNGKSLTSMWLGVAAAVAISLGVGITLELISVSLPQTQQEGMESIIGAIAVVMVTGMILWMSKNARSLKGELESQAAGALNTGSTLALAVMAFLAVLREGVETSVFLLAAFQSSKDSVSAGLGALIGVTIAVVIGYGIYRGGVKLNLARFFRVTGVFLVFVAAGLVLMSLRTAHGAGWLAIGQANTIDLSWLAPNGSPQSALLTGVLGIPADPKVIEVLAWALYLIPMLLFVLWPQTRRPSAASLPRFQRILALSLTVAALALASTVALIPASPHNATALQLVSSSDSSDNSNTVGSLSLSENRLTLSSASTTTDYSLPDQATETANHAGLDAQRFDLNIPAQGTHPKSLTRQELITLNGGRLPVGIDILRNPGPFNATWKPQRSLEVWLVNGQLIDASQRSNTELTLSGGGLPTPRTVSLNSPQQSWQSSEESVSSAVNSLKSAALWREESVLWGLWLPGLFLLAAATFLLLSFRAAGSNPAVAQKSATPQQQPQSSSSKGSLSV